MLKNKNLCKMLYYTDRNALDRPNLTEEQKYSLMNKQIKIVPKIYVDSLEKKNNNFDKNSSKFIDIEENQYLKSCEACFVF